jgi:hypothetical protein
MAMIYVKAKPGRRAYFEGQIIPEDKFVPVTDTPYVRRLVHHWQDVEIEGGRMPDADRRKKNPVPPQEPPQTAKNN